MAMPSTTGCDVVTLSPTRPIRSVAARVRTRPSWPRTAPAPPQLVLVHGAVVVAGHVAGLDGTGRAVRCGRPVGADRQVRGPGRAGLTQVIHQAADDGAVFVDEGGCGGVPGVDAGCPWVGQVAHSLGRLVAEEPPSGVHRQPAERTDPAQAHLRGQIGRGGLHLGRGLRPTDRAVVVVGKERVFDAGPGGKRRDPGQIRVGGPAEPLRAPLHHHRARDQRLGPPLPRLMDVQRPPVRHLFVWNRRGTPGPAQRRQGDDSHGQDALICAVHQAPPCSHPRRGRRVSAHRGGESSSHSSALPGYPSVQTL